MTNMNKLILIRVFNEKKIFWPIWLLLLILLSWLLAGCGGGSVSAESTGSSLLFYSGACHDDAVYSALVMGDYTDKLRIVWAPVINPTTLGLSEDESHSEAQAFINGKWYWARKVAIGVCLYGSPLVPLDMNEAVYYNDIIKFVNVVLLEQNNYWFNVARNEGRLP